MRARACALPLSALSLARSLSLALALSLACARVRERVRTPAHSLSRSLLLPLSRCHAKNHSNFLCLSLSLGKETNYERGNEKTRVIEWRRPIGGLSGHYLQKNPIISGSFAKNDLQLEASSGDSPPCTHQHACANQTQKHTHTKREIFRYQGS